MDNQTYSMQLRVLPECILLSCNWNQIKLISIITFIFMHLADVSIWSDLHCIQGLHVFSSCIQTHDLCFDRRRSAYWLSLCLESERSQMRETLGISMWWLPGRRIRPLRAGRSNWSCSSQRSIPWLLPRSDSWPKSTILMWTNWAGSVWTSWKVIIVFVKPDMKNSLDFLFK